MVLEIAVSIRIWILNVELHDRFGCGWCWSVNLSRRNRYDVRGRDIYDIRSLFFATLFFGWLFLRTSARIFLSSIDELIVVISCCMTSLEALSDVDSCAVIFPFRPNGLFDVPFLGRPPGRLVASFLIIIIDCIGSVKVCSIIKKFSCN